jgi:hypothetical protein
MAPPHDDLDGRENSNIGEIRGEHRSAAGYELHKLNMSHNGTSSEDHWINHLEFLAESRIGGVEGKSHKPAALCQVGRRSYGGVKTRQHREHGILQRTAIPLMACIGLQVMDGVKTKKKRFSTSSPHGPAPVGRKVSQGRVPINVTDNLRPGGFGGGPSL